MIKVNVLYLSGIFLMILQISVFSKDKKIIDHSARLKEVFELRNLLLERSWKARWLPIKRHDKFMKIFNEKGSSYMPFEWYDEEARSFSVDRFSIYGGHFFGFRDIYNNKEILAKVSSMADKIKGVRLQTSETLQLAELQFDYMEMLDLLSDQGYSKTNYADIHEKFKKDLRTIFLSLTIERESVEGFANVFKPEDYTFEKAQEPTLYRFDTKMLQHDRVSNFRTRSEIYLLGDKKDIIDFKAFLTDRKSVDKTEATATLLLVDYPICHFSDGTTGYLPLPKTIRAGKASIKDGYIVQAKFVAYRLDSFGEKDQRYRRITEESGGVPFMELPNVANGMRAHLSVSCINCHGGGMMLQGDKFELSKVSDMTNKNFFSARSYKRQLEFRNEHTLSKELIKYLKESK
jgi:hypothetical protein